MYRLDSIKRQARKEAWYGDSMNPFRKTGRSSTWHGHNDIESAHGAEDETSLSNVQTEPIGRSSGLNGEDHVRRSSKTDEFSMTTPSGAARSSDPESTTTGTTIVEKPSTRPPSDEEKARRRFVGGFFKRNKGAANSDEEEKPKKRAWYKGKILKHKPFTVRNQLQATIFNSWINILLLAAPVGIAVNYAHLDGKVIFCVNFIAIIPLAAMLSFATEEIALHVGESLGGLLNASFGNAVEIIVAVIALAKDNYIVVQTSLIGSMLSNLLLVLGMCFFFGGLRRQEQFFNQTIAQTAASLLALAIGSIIIPTCFAQFGWPGLEAAPVARVAALSRGTSVILLVVYACYLFFQLKTHSEEFSKESQKVAKKPRKNALPEGAIFKGLAKAGGVSAGPGRANMGDRPPNDELILHSAYEETPDEPEEPQLHIAVAWATLAIATAIIGLCAEFMVDGISSITESGAVSLEFVGLILLPIVGNAAEHATAVTVAVKDKMDLAIGVAVGSSMQIALLVLPLVVVIGWIMDKDGMNLNFDGFQVAVLFIAVLLVNYITVDGKSTWLEGMLLQCLYLIIAVCAWYYPQVSPS
ncbi:Vacuolar calcium ion transporter [Lachnellula willkommii]|uniref:Vacuolar calcium ion transporter n=1 Tax=Lachnellula willkommii TaxID=215461 RepID=A0A559M6N3_9HELO|nr:Vacuolar calcium ion transporter [Lachnellula willkommii]